MNQWDTSDTGNVVAHEFGHMLGHPDEYADATCPARNPVNTGTVMDDNTETVARLYNRLAGFHGSGHVPVAAAPEPGADANSKEANVTENIDNLTPRQRAKALDNLRAVADGAMPAGDTHVSFEVTGGAPGERYVYRLGVSGDGSAEKRFVDELHGREQDESSGTVDRELTTRVFAAARDAGLLSDAPPQLPGEPTAQLVPDSMVAIITVRDGDAVRRIAVPAAEPGDAANEMPGGAAADVPLETDMQLPAESVAALQPLLDALRGVEAAL
jgi:hypothetical protein